MFSGKVFQELRNILVMPLPLPLTSELSYFNCIRIFVYYSLSVEHHSGDCRRKHKGQGHAQKDKHCMISIHLSASLPLCFRELACPGPTSGWDLKKSNSHKQRRGWSLQGYWGRCCTMLQHCSYTVLISAENQVLLS